MHTPPCRAAWLAAVLSLLAPAGAALPQAPGAPRTPPAALGRPSPPLEAWKTTEPVPVRFDGKTLFYVRGGVAELTPAVRAERIESRLQRVASQPQPPGPVHVEEGLFSDLYVGDQFVASITDEEAGVSGPQRAAYAKYVAEVVREALQAYREERAPRALLRSGIGAAIATACLVAFLLLLRWVRRRLAPRISAAVERIFSRARIQGADLLTVGARGRLIRWAGRGVHLALVLLAFFTWLQVVAHLFPWTRDPADRSLAFTLGAAGSVLLQVVRFLPNLVYIALFALLGYAVNSANRIFFKAVERGAVRLPDFYPEWSPTTARLVSVLVYGLVAVAIYPYLPGAGSSAFQAIGIFFGAMISLGSGSSVANAISGVVLTYMRPFVVGDFVRIADATGTVAQHNMLAVKLTTIRNETVTIPASMVLANQILNYSDEARSAGVAIATSVTIGYDTPWRRIHELLLGAAAKTSRVRSAPKPWVIQRALDDFYVRYELDVYIEDPSQQHFILSELNQNVQDVFFEAGVEILSPHYAMLRDGNKPAIPDPWLPSGSEERSFRVTASVHPAPSEGPEPATPARRKS
ncbi:MAG TPA: mechanosensitive ion channel family protein [Anaeromyxobacteraceae bacterium]|nr:mechanosensitive ion channel family protein [Anaeromyxobacteraceae bacterium]